MTTTCRPHHHQRHRPCFNGLAKVSGQDSQQSSSVARQVFPEENPSVTVPVSEAKSAEDIPAASTDEEERREERVATPPAPDQIILEENVTVQDPPIVDHMEVENNEAATNTAEANDPVLAEDHVEPEANVVSEANVNLEASAMPVPTNGAFPPPRPHTMERAFNRDGELVTVRWPILVPPTAPGPQYDYHVEQ